MFHDVELDLCPAYGWMVTPQFNTRIHRLANGHERRNAQASLVRHMFTLPFQNITDEAYLTELKSFFMAMTGRLDAFKVKDYSDYLAVDESIGNAPADLVPVQLRKVSSIGAASYIRTITKPVSGAIIKQAGVAKAGTLDTLTGLFTPSTAWTEGEPLTWTGEFRVPVRFDSDALPMTIDNRAGEQYAMNGSVSLIEVFGE